MKVYRSIKSAFQFLRDRLAEIVLALSAISFLAALCLPFFKIEPGFGGPLLEGILEVFFGQSFDPESYSVLGGIYHLYTEGGLPSLAVAGVLLVFSVLFPAVKLITVAFLLPKDSEKKKKWLGWLTTLGPWSMADVFVVSIMVVAFKGFPGGTRISVDIGYYVFLASVILAMIATTLIKRRHRSAWLENNFAFRPGCRTKKRSAIERNSREQVERDLRHNKLQKIIYRRLARQFGKENVGTEIAGKNGRRIDIVVRREAVYWFYEIKTAESARACVREALGQIL
jgi:hypothetical protein